MKDYKKKKKIIISISVDEEIIKKARKQKLNVSAICNDAIEAVIND